jgi:hypothetical protein
MDGMIDIRIELKCSSLACYRLLDQFKSIRDRTHYSDGNVIIVIDCYFDEFPKLLNHLRTRMDFHMDKDLLFKFLDSKNENLILHVFNFVKVDNALMCKIMEKIFKDCPECADLVFDTLGVDMIKNAIVSRCHDSDKLKFKSLKDSDIKAIIKWHIASKLEKSDEDYLFNQIDAAKHQLAFVFSSLFE